MCICKNTDRRFTKDGGEGKGREEKLVRSVQTHKSRCK